MTLGVWNLSSTTWVILLCLSLTDLLTNLLQEIFVKLQGQGQNLDWTLLSYSNNKIKNPHLNFWRARAKQRVDFDIEEPVLIWDR